MGAYWAQDGVWLLHHLDERLNALSPALGGRRCLDESDLACGRAEGGEGAAAGSWTRALGLPTWPAAARC